MANYIISIPGHLVLQRWSLVLVSLIMVGLFVNLEFILWVWWRYIVLVSLINSATTNLVHYSNLEQVFT